MGRRQTVFSGLIVILPAILLGVFLVVECLAVGYGQDSVRPTVRPRSTNDTPRVSDNAVQGVVYDGPNSGSRRSGGFKNYIPPAQTPLVDSGSFVSEPSGTLLPRSPAVSSVAPPAVSVMPTDPAASGVSPTEAAGAVPASTESIDWSDVPEFPYAAAGTITTFQPESVPETTSADFTINQPFTESTLPESPSALASNPTTAEPILPESPATLASNPTAAEPILPESPATLASSPTAAEPVLPESPATLAPNPTTAEPVLPESPATLASGSTASEPVLSEPSSMASNDSTDDEQSTRTVVEAGYPPATENRQAPVMVAQVPANAPSSRVPAQGQDVARQSAPAGTSPAQIPMSSDGIIPPPENFSMTREQEALLDQFLLRWEEFGKQIKRVACEVQIKEHDGGVFLRNTGNSKIPLSHTWGKFKFIAPNKLLYHVEGEYVYQPGTSSDDEPKMEFKKGSGELKYVCDGKSWAEYDFRNRVVNIHPIPEDQWNMDLSMDGPFPLFFIANAKNLKNRFYMNLVTPKGRQDQDVWIEAYPRQAADAGSFQRIILILRLSDLQPSYMRKYYVNGKSYSELWFQNVSLNKGIWNIETTVDFGWEKKIKEESFAITPIAPPVQQSNPNLPSSGVLPQE